MSRVQGRSGGGSDLTSQQGVTLIELIVMMVIVGIIGISAGAKWQGDLSFYSMADQLVNEIRRAQSLAMSKEGNHTILTTTSNSVRIQDAVGAAVDPVPTTFANVAIVPFSITFDGRGDPGAVNRDVQLTMEGETLTLRVVGNTGAVCGYQEVANSLCP
ncbi:MAG: type II secretion system protein [Magnetococcales bacterium]|nr:type II secretion system protein [Magnetococcales bacterium]